MIRKEHANQDYAISPVVGVMLLLVILVVIGGVFAVAALGVFVSSEKPISAEFIYLQEDDNTYVFEMTAGEPFQIDRLRIIYTSRKNLTAFNETTGIYGSTGTNVGIGDRLVSAQPSFTKFEDSPVIWRMYDKETGCIVSSGEIS